MTVFAAILSAGIVPGLWAGRWGSTTELDEVGSRLSRVPMTVGEWTGRDLEVTARERAVAQASGLLHRRYVSSRTGGAITIMLVCGRPGPVAVHTPEVCFRSSGHEEIGTAFRFDVPAAPGDHL